MRFFNSEYEQLTNDELIKITQNNMPLTFNTAKKNFETQLIQIIK